MIKTNGKHTIWLEPTNNGFSALFPKWAAWYNCRNTKLGLMPDLGLSLGLGLPVLLTESNRGFDTGLMTLMVWPRSRRIGGILTSNWFGLSILAGRLLLSSFSMLLGRLLLSNFFSVRGGLSMDEFFESELEWRDRPGEDNVGLWGGFEARPDVIVVVFCVGSPGHEWQESNVGFCVDEEGGVVP